MHQLSELLVVRRAFLTCLGALILILTGATLVGAQDLVQPDGRINQVAHFGGDAFYCVDDNFIATTNYPEMIVDGGFRLLNSTGQELWFVPAADILAAIEASVETKSAVLVGEGQGTYGPVRLHTYFDGKDQQFVFSGYDEYGKPNSLTFIPCTPVGPIPAEPSEEELCTLVTEIATKRLEPVKGFNSTQQIPCDDCPPLPRPKQLLGKYSDELEIVPVISYCLEDGLII